MTTDRPVHGLVLRSGGIALALDLAIDASRHSPCPEGGHVPGGAA